MSGLKVAMPTPKVSASIVKFSQPVVQVSVLPPNALEHCLNDWLTVVKIFYQTANVFTSLQKNRRSTSNVKRSIVKVELPLPPLLVLCVTRVWLTNK